MYLSLNIKYLRKKHKVTQSDLASTLSIGRGSISNYEKEISSPDYDTLIKIADFFNVSVDSLLKDDLSMSRNDEKNVKNLVKNVNLNVNPNVNLNYKNHENVKTTAITNKTLNEPYMTYNNKQLVLSKTPNLFIPVHLKTHYTMTKERENYEYINVPSVKEDARTFEIEGYRLAPYLTHGDYLICTYINQLQTIKRENIYAIVSKNGIFISFIDIMKDTLLLRSTNDDLYPATSLAINEIKEIWEGKMKITKHIIPADATNQATIKSIQQDYTRLKSQIQEIENSISKDSK